jgi:hypothetical protein
MKHTPVDQTVEPCPLRIGDRVFVDADRLPAAYREDWRGVEAYVAGIVFSKGKPSGHDVTISEVWPPKCNGDLTDGFDADELVLLTRTSPQPDQETVEHVRKMIERAAFKSGYNAAFHQLDRVYDLEGAWGIHANCGPHVHVEHPATLNPGTGEAQASLKAGEPVSTKPAFRSNYDEEAVEREFLLLASYCGGDNAACNEMRPCSDCLVMCNVFDERGAYLRELGAALNPPPGIGGEVEKLRERAKVLEEAVEPAITAIAAAIAFCGRGPGGTNNRKPTRWAKMCGEIADSLVPIDTKLRAALSTPAEQEADRG